MQLQYESDEIPDLSEIGGHWDPREVRVHGSVEVGLPGWVAPGRRIARIPGRQWPNEPEECRDDTGKGEWILDGRVLLCRGCGLDAT